MTCKDALIYSFRQDAAKALDHKLTQIPDGKNAFVRQWIFGEK